MNYFAVFAIGLLFILGALIGVGLMVGVPGQWIAIVCAAIVGVAILVGATKFHKHSKNSSQAARY